MRLDRRVRFIVDVDIRDDHDPKPGDFDKVVRDTQRQLGFIGPIRTAVRDETLSVSYLSVISTREVPKE